MPNKYPIVLAHGIAPFNVWSPLVEKVLPAESAADSEYFKRIAPDLQNAGHTVFTTHVSFASRLEQRARELGEQIESFLAKHSKHSKHSKVHIIGHSMGGLDSRCLIATNPRAAARVASLTTIGTPHNGTPVADFWHLSRKDSSETQILAALRPILDLEGFRDLTTVACAHRNHEWRDTEAANSVFYQTYSSWEEKSAVFPALHHAWQIIHDAGDDDEHRRNDGLVPVYSQRWHHPPKKIEQRQFEFQADHLNEIAWWDVGEVARGHWLPGKFEKKVREVYVDIARSISARDL